MSFIEPTTRVIRAPSIDGASPTALIKDTCTVEDVLFAYTRAKAASKLRDVGAPNTPVSVRLQITRVPYVR